MLVSDSLKHSFRVLRELEKLRKIKQYRNVTHKLEVAALTEEKMEENNWDKIKEAEGWPKAFKYKKEKYVKEQLDKEYEEIENREKAIDDITIEMMLS